MRVFNWAFVHLAAVAMVPGKGSSTSNVKHLRNTIRFLEVCLTNTVIALCVCCAVECGKVCTVCEGLEKCFWWSGAAQWPAPRSRPRCYCVCECHSLRLIEMSGCMLIFYSSSLRMQYAWAACRRITRNNRFWLHCLYKLAHNARTLELGCWKGR